MTVIAVAAILVWAKQSGTPLHALGLVRPTSWATTIAVGVAFGIVLKLLMKSVVMPLLGASELNHAYQYLVGNTAALPEMLFTVVVIAGFGEELVYRGFLFNRLSVLAGSGAWGKAAVVLLTSALFGVVHRFDQGLPGVQQATVVGLVFGSIFAVTRQLWPLIVAHAAFDVTAVFIIYWNLEATVAHLVW